MTYFIPIDIDSIATRLAPTHPAAKAPFFQTDQIGRARATAPWAVR